MKKFEFLEHTADIYIQAYGKTLKQAFEHCALGLNQQIVDLKNVEKKVFKKIKVKAEDLQSLLIDFLSKFLYFLDVDGLVFSEVKITKFDKKNFSIEAIAKGEKFDLKKHEEGCHVKAITYHDLTIKKKKDIWVIKVLIDI